MRYFILVTTLNDLEQNLPTYVRCLVASLLLSHSIRKDTTLGILLPEETSYIEFLGSKIRQLRADEQSASGIVLKAIRGVESTSKVCIRQVHPGVLVRKLSKSITRLSDLVKPTPPSTYLVLSRSGKKNIKLSSKLRSVILMIPIYEDLLRYVKLPTEAVNFIERPTISVEHLIVLMNTILDRLGV